MKLDKLLNLQAVLDDRIRKEHNLYGRNLVHKKVLAFLVELGELANETRCFKFWSLKPASEAKVILEEYVDGIHFILSLAIELNATDIEIDDLEVPFNDLTLQFRKVFAYANKPIDLNESQYHINDLFTSYVQLGEMLGFPWEEIEQAYISKNEINHKRQDTGY